MSSAGPSLTLAKNTRILLVDHDEQFVANSSRIFAQGGYEEVTVLSNFEALFGLLGRMEGQALAFDILLVETHMPNMSGLEMVEQMKQLPTFKNVPFIMLSGSRSVNDLIQAFQHGASDFLYKPINPAELILRMAKVTQTHQKLLRADQQQEMFTELQEEMAVFRKAMTLDSVTQLNNQKTFYQKLRAAARKSLKNNSELGVMAIEIDAFAGYVSQYGQEHADKCLQAVAQQVESLFNEYLVARYSDGCFAVSLGNDIKIIDLKRLTGEISAHVKALCIPHANSGDIPFVTVSIGAALVSLEGGTSSEIEKQTFEQALIVLSSIRDAGGDYSKVSAVSLLNPIESPGSPQEARVF